MLLAAVSLFVNGFGVYLTIRANLGAAPWDVLNIGLSRSLGILCGEGGVHLIQGESVPRGEEFSPAPLQPDVTNSCSGMETENTLYSDMCKYTVFQEITI
ncbi:MAG: hypothetical protein IJS22_07945 [Lachnospiraceae bacterium]|nr:hypothetical protein [Lachnospiraceae bacterium]